MNENLNVSPSEGLIPKNILVHFLDHEILHNFGVDKMNKAKVFRELAFSFRVALLLASDKVILPSSHFFESEYARNLLEQHKVFNEFGYINLALSTLNIGETLFQKQQQYKIDRERYPLYFTSKISDLESNPPARWILKTRNSTKDITEDWLKSVGDYNIWERIYNFSDIQSVSTFEEKLISVPNNLEGSAFIADFVSPLLPFSEETREIATKYINVLIQRSYIDSFIKTYEAGCLDELTLFDTSVLLPRDKPRYSISRAKRYLYEKNLLQFVKRSTAKELLQFKLSPAWATERSNFCFYIWLNPPKLISHMTDRPQKGENMDHTIKHIKVIERHLNECVEYLEACYEDTLGGAVLKLSARKKINELNGLISEREAELLSLVANVPDEEKTKLLENLAIVRSADGSEQEKNAAKTVILNILGKIKDKIIDIGGEVALQLILRSVGLGM